jgi:ADP-glucose pyrophosphorylase
VVTLGKKQNENHNRYNYYWDYFGSECDAFFVAHINLLKNPTRYFCYSTKILFSPYRKKFYIGFYQASFFTDVLQ